MTETTCRCGTPTRDSASTCDNCLTTLYNLLTDDIPWLDEQLDVSIANQRAVSLQPGQATTGTGVMLNHHAHNARRQLDRILNQWVTFCLDHDVRNSAPNRNPPHPRAGMTERAQWLAWRVDGLAWWPNAHHAKAGIEAAVNRARDVVLWKPPVHVFLGKCNLLVIIGQADDTKVVRCNGDVYAPEDAGPNDTGRCRSCNQDHLIAGMREKLEAELDSRLCTVAEIARMMIYLGADVPRRRIENRLYQWKKRGIIVPVPCAATDQDDSPRYRYGDVRGRLAAEYKPQSA